MKVLLFLLVILAVAAGTLWSGIYNISALEPHWDVTHQILGFARDRSIAEHSESVRVPAADDQKLAARGAGEYHAMCRICHGAPGVPAETLAQGLYPAPSDLLAGHVQKKWASAQLYWIVENGIKMTGMPAFGTTHERDEMIGIVAFVKRLPGMTPEQYQSQVGETGHGEEQGHHH